MRECQACGPRAEAPSFYSRPDAALKRRTIQDAEATPMHAAWTRTELPLYLRANIRMSERWAKGM